MSKLHLSLTTLLASLFLGLPPIIIGATDDAIPDILLFRFLAQLFVVLLAGLIFREHYSCSRAFMKHSKFNVFSGLCFAVYLLLFFSSVRRIEVDSAIFISTAFYLIVFGWAGIVGSTAKTRVTRILGVLFILFGLLSTIDASQLGYSSGELMAVASSIFFAGYLYFGRRAWSMRNTNGYFEHAITVSLVGLVVVSPIVISAKVQGGELSTGAIIPGLAMGICTGLGHLGISVLLFRSSLLSTAAASAISPILSAVIAVFLFRHEGIVLALTTLLIGFSGVWLMQWRSNAQ